jgi:type VI secretion system protein ImpG
VAQDLVERAFLAELEALEKFRISYSGMFPNAPLAREDPDVRRLIEAMAMFTARTRVAAHRSIDDSLLRIFRQHFPYLLGPVPAMAMLCARPTARYVDATLVPRGTEVYLISRPEREGDTPEVFRFRTLAKLRLLPIEITGVEIIRLGGRGYRLLLRMAAAFPRNDEIGELSLHINHLNDLRSSLTVLHELKAHLSSASVVFDQRVDERTPGQPCEVHFGAPMDAPHELDPAEHPLQRSRVALRFPRQELYMNLGGVRTPRNWREITVVLEMKESWPRELKLTADGFQLHTVPMVNLRRDMASPIEHDGTKERHRVQHPDVSGRFVPHWVLGVYKMTKEGLAPLEPSVVGIRRESYDVVTEGQDLERKAYVSLKLPDAFEKPERVALDAFWHQPGLQRARASDFKVGLAERLVDGIEWSCSGSLVPHLESDLAGDREGLLQLLSLKNQRFLGLEELIFLLRALGAHREPLFAKLVSALSAVSVGSKPFAKRSHGFKYIYEITFDGLTASDLPSLDLFCAELLRVLTVWSVEEVVEIVARAPELGKVLRFS